MEYSCVEDNVIEITRKSSFTLELIFENPDGTPLDLTGATAAAEIRSIATGALQASFSSSILAPTTGIVKLVLEDEDTASLTAAQTIENVWGCMVSMPDGSVLPEIQGGVMIYQNVVGG